MLALHRGLGSADLRIEGGTLVLAGGALGAQPAGGGVSLVSLAGAPAVSFLPGVERNGEVASWSRGEMTCRVARREKECQTKKFLSFDAPWTSDKIKNIGAAKKVRSLFVEKQHGIGFLG